MVGKGRYFALLVSSYMGPNIIWFRLSPLKKSKISLDIARAARGFPPDCTSLAAFRTVFPLSWASRKQPSWQTLPFIGWSCRVSQGYIEKYPLYAYPSCVFVMSSQVPCLGLLALKIYSSLRHSSIWGNMNDTLVELNSKHSSILLHPSCATFCRRSSICFSS